MARVLDHALGHLLGSCTPRHHTAHAAVASHLLQLSGRVVVGSGLCAACAFCHHGSLHSNSLQPVTSR